MAQADLKRRHPAYPPNSRLYFIHVPFEDLTRAQAYNPRWARDHEALAASLAKCGDYGGATGQSLKLTRACPGNPGYAFNLAICFAGWGQADSATFWLRRAATLPGASAQIQDAAREFGGPRR